MFKIGNLKSGWRLVGSFWPLEAESGHKEAESGHRRPNLATQEAPTAQRRATEPMGLEGHLDISEVYHGPASTDGGLAVGHLH